MTPNPDSSPETNPRSLPETTPARRFQFDPIPGSVQPVSVCESLLKQPGRVLYELTTGRALALVSSLAVVAIICFSVYGAVAGSLTGGSQLWISPLKILIGTGLTALICLPSLYIFLCLGGADTRLHEVAGILTAAICLTGLLLVGFAPVAWVFSQSTDSLALMGALHLGFWFVALIFGMRLLTDGTALAWGHRSGALTVWIVIYAVVTLQMMTALRPILGEAPTFLPTEKQFFLAHWIRVLGGG